MLSPLDWAFLPLQRYVQFSGRAPRAEYWWFALLQAVLTFFAAMIDITLGLGGPEAPISTELLLGLGLFLPALAVTVRRLHDINRSGWTVLVYAAAYAGVTLLGLMLSAIFGTFGFILLGVGLVAVAIKYLILMVSEGSRGDNVYGSNPYGLTYGY